MHSLLCTYYVIIPDSTRYATVSVLFCSVCTYLMYMLCTCVSIEYAIFPVLCIMKLLLILHVTDTT